MSDTDLQLLARYSRDRADDAFAEIVRRHLDLVHSAALRQVRSPQLAEEVAQSVFTDLARIAGKLKPDTVLTAWLYQVTRRTAIDVVRREARRQLREQIATEMNAMNATTADWTQIEPLLDEAMDALDVTDRAAVLLRYFENKSLREVGQTLGTNDDAAQKRVSRAVDRLREFFAKHGVTIGASGLVVVISANAVQAAPIGLAVTISTAAALAGTTLATTATVTATKAIAMTTLQKTLIGAALAAAVGTGVYEAHEASTLRTQVKTLRQQQAPLNEQIQKLQQQHDEAARQLAVLREDNERLDRNTSELMRLRSEVTRLNSAVGKAKPTSEQKLPDDYLTMNQLQFSGYSTPRSAFESLRWALVNSNYDVWIGSMSPDDQRNADTDRNLFAPNSNWNKTLTGIQVLSEKRLGENRAELKVREDGESGNQILIWPFVLVGNEWKFHGKIHSYTKDWETNMEIPEVENVWMIPNSSIRQ
jgi:RNA polymerase sigma factor (sigma-70 family)